MVPVNVVSNLEMPSMDVEGSSGAYLMIPEKWNNSADKYATYANINIANGSTTETKTEKYKLFIN